MIELNKKDRERCNNNWDKEIETIKRKYEKDEVIEEDFETELINTIQGRYNLEELSEEEIKGQIQFVFSIRLRRLLKENDLKGKEFAKIIEVRPATISRYLKGNAFPSLANIARICKVLNVSPAYLLGLSHISSLSSWNINQELGLSIQYEEYKPLIEQFSLYISTNELEFLNLLKKSQEYIKIKNDSKKVSQDLKDIKEKIQENIFSNLDKIAEKERKKQMQ